MTHQLTRLSAPKPFWYAAILIINVSQIQGAQWANKKVLRHHLDKYFSYNLDELDEFLSNRKIIKIANEFNKLRRMECFDYKRAIRHVGKVEAEDILESDCPFKSLRKARGQLQSVREAHIQLNTKDMDASAREEHVKSEIDRIQREHPDSYNRYWGVNYGDYILSQVQVRSSFYRQKYHLTWWKNEMERTHKYFGKYRANISRMIKQEINQKEEEQSKSRSCTDRHQRRSRGSNRDDQDKRRKSDVQQSIENYADPMFSAFEELSAQCIQVIDDILNQIEDDEYKYLRDLVSDLENQVREEQASDDIDNDYSVDNMETKLKTMLDMRKQIQDLRKVAEQTNKHTKNTDEWRALNKHQLKAQIKGNELIKKYHKILGIEMKKPVSTRKSARESR